MIFQEGTTVVFQWTTPQQIKMIVGELEQRYHEVTIMWRRAQEQLECTDQIEEELDQLYNALDNFLSDLEADGHEREEAPRYNRWLDT